MTMMPTHAQSRADRFDRRARRARSLASLVMFALVGTSLTAIWQDRRLAPPVHDGMLVVQAKTAEMLEESGVAQTYLASLGNGGPKGADNGDNGITRLLLSIRD